MGLLTSCATALLISLIIIPFTLHIMSPLLPKASFLARSLTTYASALIASCVGILSAVLLPLINQRQSTQWVVARTFHHLVRLTTGTCFHTIDPAGSLAAVRPAVFISNHQTELDVLMLGALFPRHCSVTAKSSLRRVPLLGWFMALSGTVFVDRADARGARDAMDGAARDIKAARQSVFIFPEGTRSYAREPTLLPFKKGAFHLAVQAGVPIVPCVVANYSHVFHVADLRYDAGTIPVKVLDPIPTTGLTAADVPDLAQKTHSLMLAELIALTARARGQPIPLAVPAATDPAVSAEILNDHQEKSKKTVTTAVQVSM